MDIKKCLEQEHSKKVTDKIVDYISGDRVKFTALANLFLSGDSVVTQRAAWPLSIICIEHPQLIKPYVGKFVSKLKSASHPAVARNLLRIFEKTGVPEKYEGALVDICFAHLLNVESAIAVKAFAITNACNICKKYPELRNELLPILHEISGFPQTPAISHRIKLALKQLSQVKS